MQIGTNSVDERQEALPIVADIGGECVNVVHCATPWRWRRPSPLLNVWRRRKDALHAARAPASILCSSSIVLWIEGDVNMSLQGKTAIVVGGSRGLGRGAVEALAARGARVVAVARDAKTLASMASE